MKNIIVTTIAIPLIVGIVLLLIEYNWFVPSSNSANKELSIPEVAVFVHESIVKVPANEYWHDCQIEVKKGDWVRFVATGSWWSGISKTGPDGDRKLNSNACGACPVPDGYLGELVGKVGSGYPFRIGEKLTKS